MELIMPAPVITSPSVWTASNLSLIALADGATRIIGTTVAVVDTAALAVDALHAKATNMRDSVIAGCKVEKAMLAERMQERVALENLRHQVQLEAEVATLGITESEWQTALNKAATLLAA
jgi:hypothetical protein